ncbi:MAG: riboflavin biosynthesis protein RibF [Candidatus Limnocylindrales bacterium]
MAKATILRELDELPADLLFALTIGMFDGVHRGHQRAIATVVKAARERRAIPVVLTFETHPAELLRGNAPPLLSTPAERFARLAALGVEIIVVQPFNTGFAEQTPEEFLGRVCAGRRLVALVMTAESAFGRDRTGMLPRVREVARTMDFDVLEVPRVTAQGGTLSSTRLRNMLANGRMSEARRLLGRDYAVTGTVVRGDRRGRTLGYPTANLEFDAPVVLPPNGIYAVRAAWGGDDPLGPQHTANGVASLGVRPTFSDGGARVLEAHLFDVPTSLDLYGQKLRLELLRRLRGERKFVSADSLVKQMGHDAQRARAVLAQRASRTAKRTSAVNSTAC